MKGDLDFSDRTVSADERLANLFALERGFVLAMEGLLQRMIGYQALLEEEVEGRPAAAQYLRKSREAVAGAQEWLAALREQVHCELETEPLDVRLLLEGAVKRCSRILQPQATLELHLADEDILVDGALFQLQDMLMSLMLAAAKGELLGDQALVVTAATASLDDGFLRLMRSPCQAGRYFVVTFAASATAFEPARQTPFRDAVLEQNPARTPYGLRFLLGYGTVLAHYGDFFAQVEDGNRLQALTIALPVKGKIKDMQAPHNIEDEDLYGTETILLVDDEDMIWDVIIDMLQELGYSVLLAANGRDAVDIYKANPGAVDLVLLDMVMPEMDGHQAFFALQKIDPEVRVLLSSGYVSEDEARDVLEAGAAGFLHKPYRMTDLARKIRSIMDGGN